MREYSSYGLDKLRKLVEKNKTNKDTLKLVASEILERKGSPKQLELLAKVHSFLGPSINRVNFPQKWLTHDMFEDVLHKALGCIDETVKDFHFFIPEKANVMVPASIRFISLANQLSNEGNNVVFEFEGGYKGSMRYLKRMNFFEKLHSRVVVLPCRKEIDEKSKYTGLNENLVEIEEINLHGPDADLPLRLAESVINNDKISEELKNSLDAPVKTLFDELIRNVCIHSQSQLPAYAVGQVYKPGIQISVCDSGLGILETLRPALESNYPDNPEYQQLSDEELILKMFEVGLSSRGDENGGDGLSTCARHAKKFHATVNIRTRHNVTQLNLTDGGYSIDKKYQSKNVIPLNGTYITFNFRLNP